MNLFNLLERERNLNNLSTSLLADYLLNYKGDINNIKVKHLCIDAHVSNATPTRLAQNCNFDGFREFKYELNNYYKQRDAMAFYKQQIDYHEYREDLNKALNYGFENMSQIDIIKIANYIKENEIIKIYGEGQSYILGLDLQAKLNKFKKITICPSNRNEMEITAKNSKVGQLIIAISYSGTTKNVINALEAAKQGGATTILFTNNDTLDQEYDFVFRLNLVEKQMNNTSMISNTLPLILFDFICLELLKDEIAKEDFNQPY